MKLFKEKHQKSIQPADLFLPRVTCSQQSVRLCLHKMCSVIFFGVVIFGRQLEKLSIYVKSLAENKVVNPNTGEALQQLHPKPIQTRGVLASTRILTLQCQKFCFIICFERNRNYIKDMIQGKIFALCHPFFKKKSFFIGVF